MYRIKSDIIFYEELEKMLLDSTPEVINKDLIKTYIAPCFECEVIIPLVEDLTANEFQCHTKDEISKNEVCFVFGKEEAISYAPNMNKTFGKYICFYDEKYDLTGIYKVNFFTKKSRPLCPYRKYVIDEKRKHFNKFVKDFASRLVLLREMLYDIMNEGYEQLKEEMIKEFTAFQAQGEFLDIIYHEVEKLVENRIARIKEPKKYKTLVSQKDLLKKTL